MNRFVLCLLATLSVALVVSAAPIACTSPTPSDVTMVGSFDCGGLVFSDFAIAPAGNQAVTQANIAGVSYDTVGGTRVVYLELNPNLSIAAGAADIHLWYKITGNNYAVNRVGAVVGDTGHLTEKVCSDQFNGSICTGDVLSYIPYAVGPSNTIVWGQPDPFAQATTLYVYKDIGLFGPATNTSITQVYSLVGPLEDFPPTGVPEPASVMLIGTGLAAAGIFGRRAVKS